ncbi:MAG TPA: hypothetical protein VFK70_01075 [Vicinamibacteria bacterium]|nr:hypothetical protein [Vicinamibacteria bacterium]
MAAVLAGTAYIVWPLVQLVMDPQQRAADHARERLHPGDPIHQVFLTTQPFLGTGVKGGLWLTKCSADPDLTVIVRSGERIAISYIPRAQMKITETAYASLSDLAKGLQGDVRAQSCSEGLLRFGIWGINVTFSRGTLTGFSDVEYTD